LGVNYVSGSLYNNTTVTIRNLHCSIDDMAGGWTKISSHQL
jgi:hypothetical protein